MCENQDREGNRFGYQRDLRLYQLSYVAIHDNLGSVVSGRAVSPGIGAITLKNERERKKERKKERKGKKGKGEKVCVLARIELTAISMLARRSQKKEIKKQSISASFLVLL